jgi:hypothetical protein
VQGLQHVSGRGPVAGDGGIQVRPAYARSPGEFSLAAGLLDLFSKNPHDFIKSKQGTFSIAHVILPESCGGHGY